MVGFTGSRHLAGAQSAIVGKVAKAIVAAGQQVAVGCAAGADLAVRSAVPSAQVFSVAAASSRQAFALRSIQLVQAVAASTRPALIAFPTKPCALSLFPSAQSGKCFAGYGSGTWASVALAVGMGVPVFVVWCGASAPVLPAWGLWELLNSGTLSGAYRLAAVQPRQVSLF